MNKDSQSFKKNYDTLKRIADDLQRQEEPDIDELVPKVEEALRAYKFCKERIDTVREKLEQTLGEQMSTEQPNKAVRQGPLQTEQADRGFGREQTISSDETDDVPF